MIRKLLAGVLTVGLLVAFGLLLRAYGPWLRSLELKSYSDLGQAVTGIAAIIALLVAAWQVWVQRELARKRASFDFFLQTEMTDKMLASHTDSRAGFKALRDGAAPKDFVETENYQPVRRYLNVHELMAVAIHKNILDDHVCFRFWSDQMSDFRDARALINFLRENDGSPLTYADLERMNSRWERRLARERRWPWLFE